MELVLESFMTERPAVSDQSTVNITFILNFIMHSITLSLLNILLMILNFIWNKIIKYFN